MAIPFNLPTEEETEDQYRRLDHLLFDLYDVLRQILFQPQPPPGRRRTAESTHDDEDQSSDDGWITARDSDEESESREEEERSSPTQGPLSGMELAMRDFGLPDLVRGVEGLLKTESSVVPSRRKRSRPAKTSLPSTDCPDSSSRCSTCSCSRPNPKTARSWFNLGIEVRQVQEQKQSRSRHPGSRQETVTEKRRVEASSLFSVLVPTPVGGPIWTTILILVGWKLLSRQR